MNELRERLRSARVLAGSKLLQRGDARAPADEGTIQPRAFVASAGSVPRS